MKTEIIYEDADVLVVRKPAGLATQTSQVRQPDAVSELKNYLSIHGFGDSSPKKAAVSEACCQEPFLGVVHRLDQPVEGLLVFAKNKRTAAGLSAQLQGREGAGSLNKRYYAVLYGEPEQNAGEFIDYMYKDNSRKAVVLDQADWNQGDGRRPFQVQEAVLSFSVLKKAQAPRAESQSLCGMPEKLVLADIHIDTGRFHQIRAQLSHRGLPLLGDMKYGSEASIALSRQMGIKNVALCAYYLEFIHPATKERLRFRTEPEGKIFHLFS